MPYSPLTSQRLPGLYLKNCFARRLGGLLLALFAISACSDGSYQQMHGQTMGTYYSVQLNPQGSCRVQPHEVDDVLLKVNAAMSTYQADSELSLFNQQTSLAAQTVSAQLHEVVAVANEVWQRSGGAFDVTVGPLVNLWGFGPDGEGSPPSVGEQAAAARRVGMQHLSIGSGTLRKSLPDLYVDLSALAKGYGVDQIADLLRDRGCEDFMVDVGGEISVRGVNASGGAWRIGIEVPDPQALGMLQEVVHLRDISVATSGDYRNYRVVDGVRVDHVLDPRSGRPSDNRVVSATVLHPSAMWADAYATTLMVLGLEEGLAFADAQGVAAYIIVRKEMSHEEQIQEEQAQDAEQVFESSYNDAMLAFIKPHQRQ